RQSPPAGDAVSLEKGRWDAAEAALNQAEKILPDAVEIPVLRSDVLMAQRNPQAARQLLERARDRQPKKIELWVALADLLLAESQVDAALSLLDRAEKELGDGVELRLARARYHRKQGGAAGQDALAQLGEHLEKFAADDQARLLRGLADIYLQLD